MTVKLKQIEIGKGRNPRKKTQFSIGYVKKKFTKYIILDVKVL